MFGVSPRSSVGQSMVRCWPGGNRASSGRETLPVRNFSSRAQRCLLRVSLLSGGGSFSSAISEQSLVAMHRGGMFGVTHRGIDDEREKDHAAEIIIEPVFMSQRLEIERNRGRGAAEQRYCDGIGQADTKRADIGRK